MARKTAPPDNNEKKAVAGYCISSVQGKHGLFSSVLKLAVETLKAGALGQVPESLGSR